MTRRKDRISYARVLIEVDVAKKLVSEVISRLPDGTIAEQHVLCENILKFCSACQILGHAFEGCSKNPKVKGQTKEKEQKKQPVHTYKQAGTSKNQEELLKDRAKDIRGDSKAGMSKNQENEQEKQPVHKNQEELLKDRAKDISGDSKVAGDKLVLEDGLDMGLQQRELNGAGTTGRRHRRSKSMRDGPRPDSGL
ncbi:hypothetical protein M9H77_09313 [Catharanthus roseus]|uniref:Uncharacterized protein n=1 Tax=Catharanthus roseus TaxID=4058 RepID=A0ACC0C0M9_CATRO|nr:hypothetical protein M9H77_09313 [Catharanthus roseus]